MELRAVDASVTRRRPRTSSESKIAWKERHEFGRHRIKIKYSHGSGEQILWMPSCSLTQSSRQIRKHFPHNSTDVESDFEIVEVRKMDACRNRICVEKLGRIQASKA